jgi:hypothetical protein
MTSRHNEPPSQTPRDFGRQPQPNTSQVSFQQQAQQVNNQPPQVCHSLWKLTYN